METSGLEGSVPEIVDIVLWGAILWLVGLALPGCVAPDRGTSVPVIHLKLTPDATSTRHSEGDLVRLKDGSLLLVWTRFEAGHGGDHDPASIVGAQVGHPADPWPAPRVLVEADGGLNVMSATLRRLSDDRLALFYLRKSTLTDCRPVVRFSTDEAATWGPPVEIVEADDVGYDVLNNDRVLECADGSLVLAVARHAGHGMTETFNAHGRLRAHRSVDGGRTWTAGDWAPTVEGVALQEPGLFETKGALCLHARTDAGVHYLARSEDGGSSWSTPEPWTLRSPLSPATIERLPDGDLLAIWNEPGPEVLEPSSAPRTPLVAARSADDGASWGPRSVLLDDPDGWYCYVAVLVADDRMLLATCAGDRREGNGLQTTFLLEAPLPARPAENSVP